MIRFALAIVALLAAGLASAAVTLPPIPHGSTGQIVHLPIYGYANPAECPAADVAFNSEDFTLTVYGDKRGFSDVFTETDGTLATISALGTWVAPDATKANIRVTAAGSCSLEVHLPNAAFAGTNDDRLMIEMRNGTSNIVLETLYQIDMTGVTAETAWAGLLNFDASAYTTANTVGAALSVQVPALGAALAVVDGNVDDIDTAVSATIPALIYSEAGYNRLWSGAVDSVTSQTVIVATDGPATNDDHVGRVICIDDTTDDQEADCALITDYVASTFTWTLSEALQFTVAASDIMWIPTNDVNVRAMNSSEVCGNGQTGTPWTGNGC